MVQSELSIGITPASTSREWGDDCFAGPQGKISFLTQIGDTFMSLFISRLNLVSMSNYTGISLRVIYA
jgi:hypothetical protein